jgi:hypothetical protein
MLRIQICPLYHNFSITRWAHTALCQMCILSDCKEPEGNCGNLYLSNAVLYEVMKFLTHSRPLLNGI